jgi:hypothetical protein
VAVGHLATVFSNPNRNRAANQERAGQEIAARKLRRVLPGAPEAAARGPANVTRWHLAALLVVLVAPAIFGGLLLDTADEPPLPINRHLEPRVVSPGDRVTYSIDEVKARGIAPDLWRGHPVVTVKNAKKLGMPETLYAVGSDATWPEEIFVPFGSDNIPLDLEIQFDIPRDAPGGEKLQLEVSMDVTYPYVYWGYLPVACNYQKGNLHISRDLEVRLAESGQMERLEGDLLFGVAGGLAAVVGGVWLSVLTWRLQREASLNQLALPPQPAGVAT